MECQCCNSSEGVPFRFAHGMGGLCHNCAHQRGISLGGPVRVYSPQQWWAGFLAWPLLDAMEGAYQDSPCPECSTTGRSILHTGFLGCPHCHVHHGVLIASLIKVPGV